MSKEFDNHLRKEKVHIAYVDARELKEKMRSARGHILVYGSSYAISSKIVFSKNNLSHLLRQASHPLERRKFLKLEGLLGSASQSSYESLAFKKTTRAWFTQTLVVH
jgi:hypothetical protein